MFRFNLNVALGRDPAHIRRFLADSPAHYYCRYELLLQVVVFEAVHQKTKHRYLVKDGGLEPVEGRSREWGHTVEDEVVLFCIFWGFVC